MFDNIGEKIENISKIFAWIGIISGAIIALIGIPRVFSELQNVIDYGFGAEGLVLGLIYTIGGIILASSSYLISLFLCSFVKAVEDISAIKNSVAKADDDDLKNRVATKLLEK